MTYLIAFLVGVAGVFGLIIGSFLNVVAYRVPAHISLLRESRCPRCDAPVRPWQNIPVVSWIGLRGRCAKCRAAISWRYPLVELVTGVAFAGVTWWALSPSTDSPTSVAQWSALPFTLAYLYFAAIGIVLTLIDLDTKRLPNVIVLPSYIVAGVLLTATSTVSGDWSALGRAAVGMVVLYGFYALLRRVRPGGMGGGDVKLAGVIGLYLGYLGWGALVVGSFAAFLLGGVFGIVLILARRAGRRTAIPFGPWMLAGSWVGIFAGESVGRWYVGLFTGG